MFRAEAGGGDGGLAGLLLLLLFGFQDPQLGLGALEFDVLLLEPKLEIVDILFRFVQLFAHEDP